MSTQQLAKKQEMFDQRLTVFKREVAKMMPQIQAAVPDHVRANQIIRTLFNSIQANPDILVKCTPASIGKCLISAATYGLEIAHGQLGHCYLVPYGNEAQLQLSYKGIKELVRRSGEGMIFMADVREGDTFKDLGQDEKPIHEKADDPDRYKRPLTHAYAYMKFMNGFTVSRVMSRNECIAHRDRYSKNWKRNQNADNMWHEDNESFPKMCQKTCVHALANDGDIPLSADLRSALQSDPELRQPEVFDATPVPAAAITHEEPQARSFSVADVEAAALECQDIVQCDNVEKALSEQYPDHKQEIHDTLEARREHIAHVDEKAGK